MPVPEPELGLKKEAPCRIKIKKKYPPNKGLLLRGCFQPRVRDFVSPHSPPLIGAGCVYVVFIEVSGFTCKRALAVDDINKRCERALGVRERAREATIELKLLKP